MKKNISEFIGTAVLVLFGCGTAIVTEGNIIPTSLAFGLSIIAIAYSIGDISGCHINPAVSIAMYLTKKLNLKELIGYIISQVLGAFFGMGILYLLLKSSNIPLGTLGVNGYKELSAVNLSLLGAIITEIILTFVFILTILNVTNNKKTDKIAGLIIGLTLTFVHIFGIVLTGTSVNPARSLAPALIYGGKALKQVWVFILSPILGSILATITYKFLYSKK